MERRRTDEVDTGELLESLNRTTGSEALANRSPEDLNVGCVTETHFEFVVGLDLRQFGDDSRVIDVHAAKTSKRLESFFMSILLDQEARGLRQHDHTRNQDDSPSELDRNGDTIAASILTVFGRIVDNSSQKKTECDSKLVSTDDRTTDPFGCSLGLVKGDSGREKTDTKTSEEAAGDE